MDKTKYSRAAKDQSQLQQFVDEVCETAADATKTSTIHNFEEATILTDKILEEVKSGDIVKVNQMEFIVNNKPNENPRSITGTLVGEATESSVTIIKLNWIKGAALEPTMTTVSGDGGTQLYKHHIDLNEDEDCIEYIDNSSTPLTTIPDGTGLFEDKINLIFNFTSGGSIGTSGKVLECSREQDNLYVSFSRNNTTQITASILVDYLAIQQIVDTVTPL